jgi:hypothetical protein
MGLALGGNGNDIYSADGYLTKRSKTEIGIKLYPHWLLPLKKDTQRLDRYQCVDLFEKNNELSA